MARGEAAGQRFGATLRRFRARAGFSQEELAEAAGISARAVSDMERGARSRPYPETLRALATALALSPGERADLFAAARPEPGPANEPAPASAQPPAPAAEPSPRRPPVPPTPLIGREDLLGQVTATLRDDGVRLLTLTGPGGVGKTRLALEAARDAGPGFAAVAFADLAPLADPALVSGEIAAAFGVRAEGTRTATDALLAHLGDRPVLLILDNVEHLLDAAPVVASLLAGAPGLRVLVTSRAPLRLRGEREVAVAPLALPTADDGEPAAVARSPAVRLFVERAAAVRADFALTEGNAAAVAAICRRLDGLPLALELAAARARALPPAALLARLEHPLPALGEGARDLPARQRTLRAAIAWSHDLLSPADRRLFRRLAAFAGGCTPEAVEAVAAGHGGDDVLAGLERLVEHSLLRQEGAADGPRFRMLETIRAFALEALIASGEEAGARDAHAAWALELAEATEADLGGPGQVAGLDRLEAEHDNLRAALGWLLGQGDGPRSHRLGGALWRFWWLRGHVAEGRAWCARILAMDPGDEGASRARVLVGAGNLAAAEADHAAAAGFLTTALELAERLGETGGAIRAVEGLAWVAQERGDLDRAEALYDDLVARCRAADDGRRLADAVLNRGVLAQARGDHRLAASYLEQGLAAMRSFGDRQGVATALTNLGALAFLGGDPQGAAERYWEALAAWRAVGDPAAIGATLANLGEAALLGGDHREAAELYRQALPSLGRAGDRRTEAAALLGLGQAELAAGAVAPAADVIVAALDLAAAVDDADTVAAGLEATAGVAHAVGDPALAARFLGAAVAYREANIAPLADVYRPARDRLSAAVADALAGTPDAAGWDAAIDSGRRMPATEAIERARLLRDGLPVRG